MPEPVVIGVDVGGTKVAAGLVNSAGDILLQTRVPMVPTGTAEEGFAAVRVAIEEVFSACPHARPALRGIGVCSPGPLDPQAGVVLNPPNLPCWRNFPLAAEVQRVFGITARVDNDGNAAALAEALWGAGVGYRNVFYATLGTGVGTGIIFDRQIYHGRTGSAAEGGHNTIDYHGPKCGCGKRGCVEAFCSGPAIAQRARDHLARSGQSNSKIMQLAARNCGQVQPETVGEAYRLGDPIAAAVLRETAELLAVWFGNIIDLLEPDVIIVGGGLSGLMSSFFGCIREQLPRWCINPRAQEIPLLKAKYGSDSGIAGAAALCKQAPPGNVAGNSGVTAAHPAH